MVSQTNEQALEASIEKALSGITREALKDQVGNGDAAALAKASLYRSPMCLVWAGANASDLDTDKD